MEFYFYANSIILNLNYDLGKEIYSLTYCLRINNIEIIS